MFRIPILEQEGTKILKLCLQQEDIVFPNIREQEQLSSTQKDLLASLSSVVFVLFRKFEPRARQI